MTATSRLETLRLKAPLPAPPPAPDQLDGVVAAAAAKRKGKVKQRPKLPQAKPPTPPPPPPDPPQWTPGRTVEELRDQLPAIVREVHPVLVQAVVPLALGAREGLREVARPSCLMRCSRWMRAWCSSEPY